MVVIRIGFPAARYHATPWGRHVNEGVAEWPPAPYRLLRALYDVWKRKCGEVGEAAVASLFKQLASTAPEYVIPAVTASHTRSYLRDDSIDPTGKNLVFDAFVALERGEFCYAIWPEVELDEDSSAVLKRLLTNLDYLGRSESWVTADLVNTVDGEGFVCGPVESGHSDGEVVPIACALAPDQYEGKTPWIEALTMSTSEVVKRKVSGPPLLRYVQYVLPWRAVETNPPRLAKRVVDRVEAVMLGLDAKVLPLVTASIEIAEQVRVRLMGAHRLRQGGDESKVSPFFSGKLPDGGKRLDHGHIYILPLGNHMQRIDRVLLVSRNSIFKPDELDAVRGVRELYQGDGRGTIRCVLTWQGKLGNRSVMPASAIVESATPFVTVRHWRKGRDFGKFLEDEIRRECRNQRMVEPVRVMLVTNQKIGSYHCVEFRRNRRDDPPRPGYRFRLEFEEPVITPFSLGYGSHFGLGQFRASQF